MPDYRPTGRPYGASSSQRTEPRHWAQESFIPFRLEVLTPVFIGSGEDLSPLEYVIRKEGNAYALHLIDTASWLQTVQGRSDISTALNKGDMNALRRLMNDDPNTVIYSLARVPVPSVVLGKKLLDHIGDPQSLSKAEVQPLPRSPVSMAPYVPGSSLKGAMSTPLIDSLDNGALKAAERNRAYKDEMERLLGSIRNHSMQALKISDIPIPPGATRIVSAEGVRLDPGKKGMPKTPCEVVAPEATREVPLYGRLLMDVMGIRLPGGKVLFWGDLGTRCKSFYLKRFHDELGKFYNKAHLAQVGIDLQGILGRIEKLDPQRELLLRVGHYSHVECVTVSNNEPSSRRGSGKTRTLADRELPFGWVVVSLCGEAEYEEGIARVEGAITSATREREQGRAKREEQVRRAVEEQRRKAEAASAAQEEQRRKERETAEREAMLAALPPEERLITEVGSPAGTEEQSMKLYTQLDTLEDALRMNAARALQSCWQRLGKWGGKLSKKQAPKVAKVKQILGA